MIRQILQLTTIAGSAPIATSAAQNGTAAREREQIQGLATGNRRANAVGMLIKIYGGTRMQGSENLCQSCRCSRIVRGRRNDEEIVFCDAMPTQPVRIAFKVTSCTDYVDGTVPPYHELLEKAWVLTPASRKRAAGFVKGSELQEEELHRFVREHRGRE